jgi:predicted cupin superfamily sugar epimerase
MGLTAKDVIKLLELEPHPTCGYVIETYRSPHRIPHTALPAGYEGSRPFGSALYFLVAPDRPMRMHSNRSDQFYEHHMGDALEVLLLYADGNGEIKTVGSDLAAGMRPELFIPGGTFHVSRLAAGGSWALLSATAWPGVEPPDIEPGDRARLGQAYPALRSAILDFTGTRG